MKPTWREQIAYTAPFKGKPMTAASIIAGWPVIPDHDDADGTPCSWSGIISESGQCPDRCPSVASQA